MRTLTLLATAALVAATAPSFAGDRSHRHDGDSTQERHVRHNHRSRAEARLQEVQHQAGAGQKGYGWRYFSDPQARVAVVISPEGDYYYSHGKGLRWVAAAQS